MDPILIAGRAGIEHRHLLAAVVGEGKRLALRQQFPERQGGDPGIELPVTPVASCAGIDDLRPRR